MQTASYIKAFIFGIVIWVVCTFLAFLIISDIRASSNFEAYVGHTPVGSLDHVCRGSRVGGAWEYRPCTGLESYSEKAFFTMLGGALFVLMIFVRPSSLSSIQGIETNLIFLWVMALPALIVIIGLIFWLLETRGKNIR